MNDGKIELSEELVKIVNALPWNFPNNPNLPDILVEPSGFRRIVDNGMKTCKNFLDMIQSIEENIERNIPGITNFYLLTSESKNKSSIICNISGSIVGYPYDSPTQESYIERRSETDIKSELKKSIFEKVGNVMLYKGRKLDQEEIISFYTAMITLEKIGSLKVDTVYCLSTLGSVQLALDVGKLYGKSTEIIHFGDNVLQTETKPIDLLPIQHLWPIFAKVSIMNNILERLR